MGIPTRPLSLVLLFLSVALFSIPAESALDYTSLVYKGCSQQSLPDPSGEALPALLGSLVSEASKSKFFKSTAGGLTGIFQCRGDLSNAECYRCVSRLPQMAERLCGRAMAARVQLYGCYILYEVAGFSQVSGMQMLYKTCGSGATGAGFEERRDAALAAMEKGVASGHGFYATDYQSLYVVGQCEGDVGDSDCGECVKSAGEKAQVECGSSISAQIYLHKCFISYYPDTRHYPSSSSSSSSSTGKTVAIILGGAVGVGFLVICLLFARNLFRKHDDY